MHMGIARDVIAGILNASFYDVTEEYAELIETWYGEDLSLLNHDDEDLATAVWGLTHSINFWRTNPNQMNPYEKLRLKYEMLIEQHQSLLEECHALKAAINQSQETRCVRVKKERRKSKSDERIAA
jgi:hypothetical protein